MSAGPAGPLISIRLELGMVLGLRMNFMLGWRRRCTMLTLVWWRVVLGLANRGRTMIGRCGARLWVTRAKVLVVLVAGRITLLRMLRWWVTVVWVSLVLGQWLVLARVVARVLSS